MNLKKKAFIASAVICGLYLLGRWTSREFARAKPGEIDIDDALEQTLRFVNRETERGDKRPLTSHEGHVVFDNSFVQGQPPPLPKRNKVQREGYTEETANIGDSLVHYVEVTLPNGNMLPMIYTNEEWTMIQGLAEASGRSFDEETVLVTLSRYGIEYHGEM